MLDDMRERSGVAALLRAIGALAGRVSTSPDAWTVLGGVAGLGAALAVFHRAYPAVIACGLLCAFCDIADGAVARRHGRASPYGRLLDVTVDKYVEGAIVLGTALGAPPFLGFPALGWAALAIWGSILISVVSNVGRAATGGRPPRHWALKFFGRAERGLFFGLGVAIAWATGDEAWLTAIVLCAGGLISHATALALAGEYISQLRRAV